MPAECRPSASRGGQGGKVRLPSHSATKNLFADRWGELRGSRFFTKVSLQSLSLSINIICTCALSASILGIAGQEQSCSPGSSSASVKTLSLLLERHDAASGLLVITQHTGLAPFHCTVVRGADLHPSGFPNTKGCCSLRSSCGSCQHGKGGFGKWKISGKYLMWKVNRQILSKQLGEMVTHISF